MKSVLRDRSLDRNAADTGPGLPREQLLLHMEMARDRSLDRHLDRFRDRNIDPRYATFSGYRDRSLDRDKDFPHMGARSLERDSVGSNLTRSRSIDYDYLLNQSQYMPVTDFRSRDTLILDMQAQLTEMNKENAALRQELDLTREKVASSMNSIKTFWSPELKKERALRKEENAKLSSMQDQLKVMQIEAKVCSVY
jgi:ELKS/RAB6-interacting/CAST family protein 1